MFQSGSGLPRLIRVLKNLNLAALLPLLGVAIGWLLSEAGFLIRARREQKNVLGKAILRLLQMREMTEAQLNRITLATEYLSRNRLSEENRGRLAEKDWDVAEFIESSNEILSDISAVDPFLSYQLDRDMRILKKLETWSGGYAIDWKQGEHQELWDKTFIHIETVAFEGIKTHVTSLIFRLARRKGPISFVRAWRHLREDKKLSAQNPYRNLAEKIADMDESYETMKSKRGAPAP